MRMIYGPTVTLEQAAELMNVHPKTVVDHINSGTLPAAKIGRGYVMLTSDVMALVTHYIVQQTAERMRRVTPSGPPTPALPKATRRRRVGLPFSK